ncbi:MAG: nitroreductase family protein, partial [Oscillospiraceae bacterium]
MSTLFHLFEQRQSCRSYQSKPVEPEKLDACIRAARLAPSACNSQPWRFIVVNEPQRVEQLAKCVQETGMNRFTDGCTAFVVILEGNQSLSARFGGAMKDQKYAGIDIGLATAQLVLTAADEGLGSCILGWFNERKLKIL